MFSPSSDLNVKNNEGKLTDICFYPPADALTLKNKENKPLNLHQQTFRNP